jgi:hypothetical protein
MLSFGWRRILGERLIHFCIYITYGGGFAAFAVALIDYLQPSEPTSSWLISILLGDLDSNVLRNSKLASCL